MSFLFYNINFSSDFHNKILYVFVFLIHITCQSCHDPFDLNTQHNDRQITDILTIEWPLFDTYVVLTKLSNPHQFCSHCKVYWGCIHQDYQSHMFPGKYVTWHSGPDCTSRKRTESLIEYSPDHVGRCYMEDSQKISLQCIHFGPFSFSSNKNSSNFIALLSKRN